MTDPSGPDSSSRFAARVAQGWPAVVQRLGERRAAFEAAVAQRAAAHGLVEPADGARYLNLCLAFGPGFEDRTENEWALAILADERLTSLVKLHQLVQRAAGELKRRPDDAHALQAIDRALLDLVDQDRRRTRPDAPLVPRTACDVEALELRLLDTAWRQEYQRRGGEWLRTAATLPPPLRIGVDHPAPDIAHLLSGPPGQADLVRLQVRQVAHGRCSLGLHPAVHWLNGSGLSQWHDQEARSVAWALPALPPGPAAVPRLLAEPPPDVTLLEVPSCALRDTGVPLGPQKLQLWVYPAWQWLLKMQRRAPLGYELPDARSAPPAAAPTSIALERDGMRVPMAAWQQAFDGGLRAALGAGLQRLFQAWQPRAQDAAVRAEFGLFDGTAALTWGLREGARGLASAPLLRAIAELDWSARAEVHLQGMVEYAGARASLHLRIEGEARLQVLIERLLADVPLAEPMAAAVLQWRWPVQLDYDPVADDTGCVFSEVGPCTGALTGSLGLRPSPTQGGAWEWFATMAIEPVATRVVVHDPLLGRSESHLALLGSVSLLDWSLA